jgi:hypothetical protein
LKALENNNIANNDILRTDSKMILKDKIKKVFDNKMVESFTLEKK